MYEMKIWQECLKQIEFDELINILTENQDTVTVGENISKE